MGTREMVTLWSPWSLILRARIDRVSASCLVSSATAPYQSTGDPVLAVLEINGGTAARLAIRAGDRILYPAFAGGP